MIQAIRKSCWESPPRHHRTNLRLTGLLVALPFALFRSALGALQPYLHPSARAGRDVRHVRSWLLCFALHWNHTSAAFREAAGLPHVKPHPAWFRSALEPYFGRFPRGCRITAYHTAPCFVSLCIGGIAPPLFERHASSSRTRFPESGNPILYRFIGWRLISQRTYLPFGI
jgi:hypothetical protein